MKFSGLRKTSLVDFPDRVASVLFTPGCNLRCPYCHNWRIVIDPKPPFLNDEAALHVLEERKSFIDAVVVTGGEPTIHKELPNFLRRLKENGFATKLDTNGLNSQVLKECLPNLDYVAVDVKTKISKYKRLGSEDASELARTTEVLKNNDVKYEFRTTVVPGFVGEEDIVEIGELVKGARRLVLQQFVPDDALEEAFRSIKPYSAANIRNLGYQLKDYVENIVIQA